MFVLDSAKFATDPDGVSQQVIGILEKAGGTVDTHRPWQDGRLAYPIEGHRKALHYLAYFRMDGQGLTDVTRACKLNDLILRHMVIKHPRQLYDVMVQALVQDEPEVVEAAAAPVAEPAAAAAEGESESGDTESEK
jgi:small subunit ribosomal protein S6